MSKAEIDLYLGAYAALEEKQFDDQQAADRSQSARSRTVGRMR